MRAPPRLHPHCPSLEKTAASGIAAKVIIGWGPGSSPGSMSHVSPPAGSSSAMPQSVVALATAILPSVRQTGLKYRWPEPLVASIVWVTALPIQTSRAPEDVGDSFP